MSHTKFAIPNYLLILGVSIVVSLFIGLILLLPKNNNSGEVVFAEITQLSTKIRQHYQQKPGYWGLNVESALKNDIVPASMKQKDKIITSIGRHLLIGQDINGSVIMPGTRNFTITLPNLGKTACVNISSLNLIPEENLGLLKFEIHNEKGSHSFSWGAALSLPISEKDAQKYCEKKNTLSWVFE